MALLGHWHSSLRRAAPLQGALLLLTRWGGPREDWHLQDVPQELGVWPPHWGPQARLGLPFGEDTSPPRGGSRACGAGRGGAGAAPNHPPARAYLSVSSGLWGLEQVAPICLRVLNGQSSERNRILILKHMSGARKQKNGSG